MKEFNPGKELSKIRNGNKKKVIISICALLLVGVIGYSFALYQVRHTNKLTHITVKQFYQNDLDLAVYVDGIKKVTKEDFPTKENGSNLVYTGIKCEDDKEVKASWNYDNWSLDVESNLPNKCNVYFETRWKDNSGAAYPELYQGLIPVRYENSKIYIADLASEWYDYDAHEWANAVLIDYQNETIRNKFYDENGKLRSGDEVQESDILQMYVWIPRYRYKLWNVLNGTSNPFAIEIEFENNTKEISLGQTNGEWLTHPAFLFGDTELNGFWVGKFESSDAEDEIGRNSEIGEITILPNKTSMVNKTLKKIFDAEQKLNDQGNKYNLNPNEVDTRPMKNSEWGAVAYLTSSKYGRYENNGTPISSGAEVWINNTAQGTATSGTWPYGGTATGCVGNSVSALVSWGKGGNEPATCPDDNIWNKNGIKASTTGNMYGIYDMSGGTWEYTMGVIKIQNGDTPIWDNSEFSGNPPDPKYYDLYDFSESNTIYEYGHLGDATRETLSNFSNTSGGWNGDYDSFPTENAGVSGTWFGRGAMYIHNARAGNFAFMQHNGGAYVTISFRSVLSAA